MQQDQPYQNQQYKQDLDAPPLSNVMQHYRQTHSQNLQQHIRSETPPPFSTSRVVGGNQSGTTPPASPSSSTQIVGHTPTRPQSASAASSATASAAAAGSGSSYIQRNPRKTLLSSQPRPIAVNSLKALMKTKHHNKQSTIDESESADDKNQSESTTRSRRNKINASHQDYENSDDGDEESAQRVIRGGAPLESEHDDDHHHNNRRSSLTSNDAASSAAGSTGRRGGGKKDESSSSIYDLSLMSPRAVIDTAAQASESTQFTILLQPFKSTAIQGKASMHVENYGGLVMNHQELHTHTRRYQRSNSSSASNKKQHNKTGNNKSDVSPRKSGGDEQQNNSNNNSNTKNENLPMTHLGTVSGSHPLHARFSVDRGAPPGTILGATASVVCPQDEANFVLFVSDTQSKQTLSINMQVLLREERRASVQKDMQELRDALELAKRHSDDLRAQLARCTSERDRALDRIRDVEIDVQRLTAERNRLSAKERALEQDSEKIREAEQRLIQQRAREDEQEQEMQTARAREREAIRQREAERQQERQAELERAREREAERKAIEAERLRMNSERIQYAKDRQAFQSFMKQVDSERAAFQEREQQWRSSIQSAMSDVAVCEACVSRKDLEKNVELAIQRVKDMETERDKMAGELKKVMDAEAQRLSSALSLGNKIPRSFCLFSGSCESLFPLSKAQLTFRGAVHRGRIFVLIHPKLRQQQQQQQNASSMNLNENISAILKKEPMKCIVGFRGPNSDQVLTTVHCATTTSNKKNFAPPGSSFNNDNDEFTSHLTSTSHWTSSYGSTACSSYFNETEAPAKRLRLTAEPLAGSGAKKLHTKHHRNRRATVVDTGMFDNKKTEELLDENKMMSLTNTSQQQPENLHVHSHHNEHHGDDDYIRSFGGNFAHQQQHQQTNHNNDDDDIDDYDDENNEQNDNNDDETSSVKHLAKRVIMGWNSMKSRGEFLGQVELLHGNNNAMFNNNTTNTNANVTSTEENKNTAATTNATTNATTASTPEETAASLGKTSSAAQFTERQSTISQLNKQVAASTYVSSSHFHEVMSTNPTLYGWSIGSSATGGAGGGGTSGGAGGQPTALLLNATPLLDKFLPEGAQVLCFELAPGGTLAASSVSHLLKHLTFLAYQQDSPSSLYQQHQKNFAASKKLAAVTTSSTSSSNPTPSSSSFVSQAQQQQQQQRPDSPTIQDQNIFASEASINTSCGSVSSATGGGGSSSLRKHHHFIEPMDLRLRFATCLEVMDEIDNKAHPLERVEELSATIFPSPSSSSSFSSSSSSSNTSLEKKFHHQNINNKWNCPSDSVIMNNGAKGFSLNMSYDAKSEFHFFQSEQQHSPTTTGRNSPSQPQQQQQNLPPTLAFAGVFPFCCDEEESENLLISTTNTNLLLSGIHVSQNSSCGVLQELIALVSSKNKKRRGSKISAVTGSISGGLQIVDDDKKEHQHEGDSENSSDVDMSSDDGDANDQQSFLNPQFSDSFSDDDFDDEDLMSFNENDEMILPSTGSKSATTDNKNTKKNKKNANQIRNLQTRYRYMQVQLRGDGNTASGNVGEITLAPTMFDRTTGHVYLCKNLPTTSSSASTSHGVFDEEPTTFNTTTTTEETKPLKRKRIGRVIFGSVNGIKYDERGPKKSKSTVRHWSRLRSASHLLGSLSRSSFSRAGAGASAGPSSPDFSATATMNNMTNTFGNLNLSETNVTAAAGSMRLHRTMTLGGGSMARFQSVRMIDTSGGGGSGGEGDNSNTTMLDTENGDFDDVRYVIIEFDNDIQAERDVEEDGGDKKRSGKSFSFEEMEQLRDAIGFTVVGDELMEESQNLKSPVESALRSSLRGQQPSSPTTTTQNSNQNVRTGPRLLHVTFAGLHLFDEEDSFFFGSSLSDENELPKPYSSSSSSNRNKHHHGNKKHSDDDNDDEHHVEEVLQVRGIDDLNFKSSTSTSPSSKKLHFASASSGGGGKPKTQTTTNILHQQQQSNLHQLPHGPRPIRISFGANISVTNSSCRFNVSGITLNGTFRSGLRCNNGLVNQTPASGSLLLPRFMISNCLPCTPLPSAEITVSMGSVTLDELFLDISSGIITVVPHPIIVGKKISRRAVTNLLKERRSSTTAKNKAEEEDDTTSATATTTSGKEQQKQQQQQIVVNKNPIAIILYKRCQVGIIIHSSLDKIQIVFNHLATSVVVQEIVRSISFRAGMSISESAASLPRSINFEFAAFGRTQWSDTLHLSGTPPLLSFPFDAPLSRTEGDSISEPLLATPQSSLQIPAELEMLTNRSAIAVIVDIMPSASYSNTSSNKSQPSTSASTPSAAAAATTLPVQINMSRESLLESGLVLKSCHSSTTTTPDWPRHWLRRAAAIATLQNLDKDAKWIRDRIAAMSHSPPLPGGTLETFDLAASPTIHSFSSDEDAATVESATGLVRVGSLAFVGTGTLLLVFPSAATNWLDEKSLELFSRGIMPIDTDVAQNVRAQHIQGSLRSICAAVFSSLAKASQCICSIRVLTEGTTTSSTTSAPTATSSAGGMQQQHSSSIRPSGAGASSIIGGGDGKHHLSHAVVPDGFGSASYHYSGGGNSSSYIAAGSSGTSSVGGQATPGSSLSGSASYFAGGVVPCTDSIVEQRSLQAVRILQMQGVVPRGRTIPTTLHCFSSLLYVHAASTLTSLANVDTWVRGRFTAPPNTCGRATIAPHISLQQAPLSWSRGLVKVKVQLDSSTSSAIPNGYEAAVVINSESKSLGGIPIAIDQRLAPGARSASSLMTQSMMASHSNSPSSSGGKQQQVEGGAQKRPWHKLGVVRAVPEWETLLKISKHSPKVFSVLSSKLPSLPLSSTVGPVLDSSTSTSKEKETSSNIKESSNISGIYLPNFVYPGIEHRMLCFNGRCVGTIATCSDPNNVISLTANKSSSSKQQHQRSESQESQQQMTATTTTSSSSQHQRTNSRGRRQSLSATTISPTRRRGSSISRSEDQQQAFLTAETTTAFNNNQEEQQQQQPVSAPPPSPAPPLFEATMTNLSAAEVSSFLSQLQIVFRPKNVSVSADTSFDSSSLSEPVPVTTTTSTTTATTSSSRTSARRSSRSPSTISLSSPQFGGYGGGGSSYGSPTTTSSGNTSSFQQQGSSQPLFIPPPTSIKLSVSCTPPATSDQLAAWNVRLQASTKIMWHSPPLVFDSGEPVPRYLFSKMSPVGSSSSNVSLLGYQFSPLALFKRCHVGNFGLMQQQTQQQQQLQQQQQMMSGGGGSSNVLDISESTLPGGTSVTIEALPSHTTLDHPCKLEMGIDVNSATSDMGSSRQAFSLVPHADSVLASSAKGSASKSSSKSKSSSSSSATGNISSQGGDQPLRHGALYSGSTCVAEYDNIEGGSVSITQYKSNLKTKMLASLLRSVYCTLEANPASSSGSGSSSSSKKRTGDDSSSLGAPPAPSGRRGSIGGRSSTNRADRVQLLPSTSTICITFRDKNMGVIETYFLELLWSGQINTTFGLPFTIVSIPRKRLHVVPPGGLSNIAGGGSVSSSSSSSQYQQNAWNSATSVFVMVGATEPTRVGSDLFLAWSGTSSASAPSSSGQHSKPDGHFVAFADNDENQSDENVAAGIVVEGSSPTGSPSSSSKRKLPRIYVEWSHGPSRTSSSSNQNIKSSSGGTSSSNFGGEPDSPNTISLSSAGAWQHSLDKFISLKPYDIIDYTSADASSNSKSSNFYNQFDNNNENDRNENDDNNNTDEMKNISGSDNDDNDDDNSSTTSSNSSSESTENDSPGYGGAFRAFASAETTERPIPKNKRRQVLRNIIPSNFRRESIRTALVPSSSSAFGSDSSSGTGSQQQQQNIIPAHWIWRWISTSSNFGRVQRARFSNKQFNINDENENNNNNENDSSSNQKESNVVERVLFLETGLTPEACTNPIARIIRESQTKILLVFDEIELASLVAYLCELRVLKLDIDSIPVDLPLHSRVVRLFVSAIVESFFQLVCAEARPAGTGEAFAAIPSSPNKNSSRNDNQNEDSSSLPSPTAQSEKKEKPLFNFDPSVEPILRTLGHLQFGVILPDQGGTAQQQQQTSTSASIATLCKRDIISDITADPRGAAEAFGLHPPSSSSSSSAIAPVAMTMDNSSPGSPSKRAGEGRVSIVASDPRHYHQQHQQQHQHQRSEDLFLSSVSWETPLCAPFSRNLHHPGHPFDLAKKLPNFVTGVTVKFSFTLVPKHPEKLQRQFLETLIKHQEKLKKVFSQQYDQQQQFLTAAAAAINDTNTTSDVKKESKSSSSSSSSSKQQKSSSSSSLKKQLQQEQEQQEQQEQEKFVFTPEQQQLLLFYAMPHLLLRWGFVPEIQTEDESNSLHDMNVIEVYRVAADENVFQEQQQQQQQDSKSSKSSSAKDLESTHNVSNESFSAAASASASAREGGAQAVAEEAAARQQHTEEIMALHTLSSDGSIAEFSEAFTEDEDPFYFVQQLSFHSRSSNISSNVSSSTTKTTKNRKPNQQQIRRQQIRAYRAHATSVIPNDPFSSSAYTTAPPLFLIQQQVGKRVIGAARVRIRTNSNLKHLSTIAPSSHHQHHQQQQHQTTFSSSYHRHQQQTSSTASASTKSSSNITNNMKFNNTQLPSSDCELMVVFRDGFKVSRRILERLFGRVALFANSGFQGVISQQQQAKSRSSSASSSPSQQQTAASTQDRNPFQLLSSVSIIDRTHDTVLAKVDANPVWVHV